MQKPRFYYFFYFNSQEEQDSVAVDTSSQLVEMVWIPQNTRDQKQESPIDCVDSLGILPLRWLWFNETSEDLGRRPSGFFDLR